MTVASTLNKKQYQGNNLTTEFPLPFHVTAKEHIFALLKKGTKIEKITANFAVDLERKMFVYPVQGEAIKTGESLTIYRKIPLTQIVDLENAGAFHPEVLEHDGFDRIVMQIQQIAEEISRALKIDMTDMRDTSHLLPELFAAREEAVLSAQKALEQAQIALAQAQIAEGKAGAAEEWAQAAKEKAEQLTDLAVECYIGNDGQGQVTYDKNEHKLKIVLPFDNSGANQPKVVLTDRLDLARSDIGASAKAVQSLLAKMNTELADAYTQNTAQLAKKIDKTAISGAINSTSTTTVASSKAVNDLRLVSASLAMPGARFINITPKVVNASQKTYSAEYTAPANGYIVSKGFYTSIDPRAAEARIEIQNASKVIQYAANVITNSVYKAEMDLIAPIKKGNIAYYVSQGQESLSFLRFIYAQGD